MRKESIILLFLFGCHIGRALKCYTCSGECKDMTTSECQPNQQCIAKEKWTDGKIALQEKSCADAAECSAVSPDKSLTHSCCSTDLCNVGTTTTKPGAGDGGAGAGAGGAGAGGAGAGGDGTLICNFCPDYTCVMKSKTTCKAGQQCVTKSALVAGMPMEKLECADSNICSKQTTETIAGTLATVTNKCCNTNLCNFAITLKVPSIPIFLSVLFLMIFRLY